MDCKEFLQYLDLFAGGDIEGEEKRQFINHLETCSSCRKEYEKAFDVISKLNTLNITNMYTILPETKEEGFWTDIVDEVKKGISRPTLVTAGSKEHILWFSFGFSAAALILLGIWLLFGSISTDKMNIPSTSNSLSPIADMQKKPSKLVPVNGPIQDDVVPHFEEVLRPWLKEWNYPKGRFKDMDADAVPVGLRSRL